MLTVYILLPPVLYKFLFCDVIWSPAHVRANEECFFTPVPSVLAPWRRPFLFVLQQWGAGGRLEPDAC